MPRNLNIFPLTVGALRTNCYLIQHPRSREMIVVDPGDDGEYITRKISDLKGKVCLILATHGHFDHVLSVTELKLAYGVPFCLNKNDGFLVARSREAARHFLGFSADPPPEIDSCLLDGQKIMIGDAFLQVLHLPGHTPGSVCFYAPEDNFILTGDLLFAGGTVGRTDFSYSNKKEMVKSIKKVFRLPDITRIYPGHDESSTIFQEKQFHGIK